MNRSFNKVAVAVALALGAQAALAIDSPASPAQNGSLFVTVFDTVAGNSLVQVLQNPLVGDGTINYQEFTESLVTPDAGLTLTFNVDLSFFTSNGSSLSNLRYTVFAGDNTGVPNATNGAQGVLLTAEAGLATIPLTVGEITGINTNAANIATAAGAAALTVQGVAFGAGYWGGTNWGDNFASQFDLLGSAGLNSSLGFYQAVKASNTASNPAVVTRYQNANGYATWNLSSAGLLTYNAPPAVPLPAAVWLLLSGIGGLGVFGRRRAGAAAVAAA